MWYGTVNDISEEFGDLLIRFMHPSGGMKIDISDVVKGNYVACKKCGMVQSMISPKSLEIY